MEHKIVFGDIFPITKCGEYAKMCLVVYMNMLEYAIFITDPTRKL